MDEGDIYNQPLDIFHVLSTAFAVYRQHLSTFLQIGLFYGAANVLAEVLIKTFGQANSAWILLINVLISAIGVILIFDTYRRIHGKKAVDIKDSLSIARNIMPTVFAIHLSMIILFFLSLLLMGSLGMIAVIPGLYFSTIFIFAEIIAVIEKKSYIECFKTSAVMVKGMFIKVLSFNIILMFIIILPILALKSLWSLGAAVPFVYRILNVFLIVSLPVFQGVAQAELYYQSKTRRI